MHIPGQIQPFAYLGSKYSVLPWLLELLPRSNSFVDVFGGSASVILNKQPSPINVYNDINEDVVNFFRVLREQPDQLIRKIELTPYSRLEYRTCMKKTKNNVENARRFFVRVRQSFLAAGSHEKQKGWNSAPNISRVGMSEGTSKWLRSVDDLELIVIKLRTIQIENMSFEKMFEKYDNKDSLLYLDPPYMFTHRSGNRDYDHDFTAEQHLLLADFCANAKGMVAVSGYDDNEMDKLYPPSKFIKTSGPFRRNNMSKKKDIKEVLYTNYDPYQVRGQLNIFQSA